MIVFGYCQSPLSSPSTLVTLDKMYQILGNNLKPPNLQVVFVSIDPIRDNIDRLSEYVAFFNPTFKWATGGDPALRKLTSQLGVSYKSDPQTPLAEDENSLITHTTSIVIINPKGQYLAVFKEPLNAFVMANAVLALAQPS